MPGITMMKSSPPDTDELKENFEKEGYVILHDFFEPEVVKEARRALGAVVDRHADKLMADGKIQDPLKNEPFETRLFRLYERHVGEAPIRFRPELHMAELFAVFFEPRLLDVVEILLGGEILLYPNYTVRPKYSHMKKAEVLWHQDGGYTDSSGGKENKVASLRMVNAWSPLVPAHVEHGCMQFIPGSHKFGSVPHAPHPQYHWMEIAPDHLKPHLPRAIDIELDPCDIVLFHNLLFHQGLPNNSGIIRWNLDWRYMDASQSTLRNEKGHVARSRKNPSVAVRDGTDWASRNFI